MVVPSAPSCQHNEKLVRDIGICECCTRVIQYNPFEEDINAKPIILKEGHVPGLEYIRNGKGINVMYEGKFMAFFSMETDELRYIADRLVQSIAKAYLREGSLSASRSLRDQVLTFLGKGMNDEEIIGQFTKDKRDTVRRYVRDLRKERKNGHGDTRKQHNR